MDDQTMDDAPPVEQDSAHESSTSRNQPTGTEFDLLLERIVKLQEHIKLAEQGDSASRRAWLKHFLKPLSFTSEDDCQIRNWMLEWSKEQAELDEEGDEHRLKLKIYAEHERFVKLEKSERKHYKPAVTPAELKRCMELYKPFLLGLKFVAQAWQVEGRDSDERTILANAVTSLLDHS